MPGSEALARIRSALVEPASNIYLCGFVSLAAALLLLVEVALLPFKGTFFVAAIPTAAATLALVYALAKGERRRLDGAIARAAAGVGLAGREPLAPKVFALVLYCAGIVGSVAGYACLALTNSGISRQDVIVQWGLLDKRPLVFAYLVIVAFAIFHQAMVCFLFEPRRAGREAAGEKPRRRWTARLLGAGLIAVLAYGWIGVAALGYVNPGDGTVLARFYEYHSHVHLGALEQIRLGAMPYLEAQTQYGPGNQLLLYAVTDFVNFSNHGFYAGVILVDVVCVVGFFVVVQQLLGLGWAVAGLLGWALWPSPAWIIDLAGWAVLTRWLAVPVLALLLARLLLNARPARRAWIGPVLAGTIWGAGGFLSQENATGGLLVAVLSLALYGPVSGMRLQSVARFAALFFASGAVAFVLLVAGTLGISHSLDVLRQANAQSSLVMAGVSNSVWSDDVGLALRFDVVNGWPLVSVEQHGDLRPLFQTYGFALLLMVSIAMLAGFLGRRWTPADDRQRQFVWKFAGVAVGAYALHLFTLLRSDQSHLSGPSFLLPLFLLMLPLFAWRCVKPGLARGVLLAVSAGLIVEALFAGGAGIGRRMEAFGTAWRDSAAALDVYRELRRVKEQPADPAARYSPIPKYQVAFRNHPYCDELQELAGLLRDRLQGRPVELVFPRLDDPTTDAELLYFFGAFRSVSGITSQRSSIWLRSDEDAWIDKVLKAKEACVFFDFATDGRPAVRRLDPTGESARRGRHAADRRQAPLRRAVLQELNGVLAGRRTRSLILSVRPALGHSPRPQ